MVYRRYFPLVALLCFAVLVIISCLASMKCPQRISAISSCPSNGTYECLGHLLDMDSHENLKLPDLENDTSLFSANGTHESINPGLLKRSRRSIVNDTKGSSTTHKIVTSDQTGNEFVNPEEEQQFTTNPTDFRVEGIIHPTYDNRKLTISRINDLVSQLKVLKDSAKHVGNSVSTYLHGIRNSLSKQPFVSFKGMKPKIGQLSESINGGDRIVKVLCRGVRNMIPDRLGSFMFSCSSGVENESEKLKDSWIPSNIVKRPIVTSIHQGENDEVEPSQSRTYPAVGDFASLYKSLTPVENDPFIYMTTSKIIHDNSIKYHMPGGVELTRSSTFLAIRDLPLSYKNLTPVENDPFNYLTTSKITQDNSTKTLLPVNGNTISTEVKIVSTVTEKSHQEDVTSTAPINNKNTKITPPNVIEHSTPFSRKETIYSAHPEKPEHGSETCLNSTPYYSRRPMNRLISFFESIKHALTHSGVRSTVKSHVIATPTTESYLQELYNPLSKKSNPHKNQFRLLWGRHNGSDTLDISRAASNDKTILDQNQGQL